MLRFDVPAVDANVVRWEAFLVCCASLLALFVSPWFMIAVPFQGLVKGFIGHHKCPSHQMWKSLFTSRGWDGKRENAGAKMFASKILFLASAVSLTLFFLGVPQWRVPATVLAIFSFIEWAFSFCVACEAYNTWYRFFPPKQA